METEQQLTSLVVIGASAGGIEALSTLVSTLPAAFPAPVVVAQHLDPRRPSHLAEILGRRSTVPVRTVTDHARLEPSVIFVVPSNRHVAISDHQVRLHAEGPGRSTPSVNLLFESAAQAYGERLIAVVLTGTDSDGAAGALHVKEAGGTVLIQDPQSAAFPSMPASLAPATVDIVAPLEQIGPLLHALVTGAYLPELGGSADGTLPALLAQVRERSGIDFTRYKTPTIQRRLQRRMVAVGTERLADYYQYLQAHPEEYQSLVTSFLIKVTEFFRDPELFSYLRAHVLPELLAEARRAGRELRVWSAGCATGQEAYSLAILLAEVLGDTPAAEVPVRLFATDLDAAAIAFARRGVYPAAALASVAPELVERFFTPLEGAYEVRKSVRSLTVFGEHDLGQRAPFPHIDLCVCRNVLIYFTPELQQRALEMFTFSVREGGYLVLGKSETLRPVAEYFAPVQAPLRVYQRHGGAQRGPLLPRWDRPARAGRSQHVPGARRAPTLPPPQEQPVQAGLSRLLLGLPVGVVVVNQHYHIQLLNNAARSLLGLHSGGVGEDLIHLARDLPARELRAALDAAFRSAAPRREDLLPAAEPAVEVVLPVETPTGTPRYLQLACYPQAADTAGGPAPWDPDTVLLVVRDVTGPEQARRTAAQARASAQHEEEMARLVAQHGEERTRLAARVQGLATTNAAVQAANLQLGAENLELRRAHEEALLRAEEAQAAAEEVETLNEELQASGEELETLNEELHATVEELHTTNADLAARGVELEHQAATLREQQQVSEAERQRLREVFVHAPAVLAATRGPRHLLTFANPAYRRLAGRDEGDLLGHPAPDVFPAPGGQDLTALLDQVYATGQPVSGLTVTVPVPHVGAGTPAETTFEVSYQPLRTEAGTVEGILIHGADVTALAAALAQVSAEQARLAAVLGSMSDAVVVVDADGMPVLTNDAYVTLRGAGGTFLAADEQGQPLPPAATPQQRAARGESFTLSFTVTDAAGIRHWYEASGRPLHGTGNEAQGLLVIRDITERSLRRLQEEFVALATHELRTPLTAASGYLDLLLRRLGSRTDDARLLHDATVARRQLRHLQGLVNDLVDVERLQSGKLRLALGPVDLGALLAQAIAGVQFQAEGRSIALDTPPEPLVVQGDALRLEQVALNLLTNALTHAPDSSRIDARLWRAEGGAAFAIQDYGPGIAETEVAHLFTRFYQVEHATHRGLGLGLFIAQELVTAHGGHIVVESTLGVGTTFTVWLPLPEETETTDTGHRAVGAP